MNDPMLCFRLLAESDKGSRLLAAVETIRDGVADPVVTWTHLDELKKIPTSPFAYWVSEPYRRLFSTLPTFESEGRRVLGGLKTMCDERFVRAWWEVESNSIRETGWARFAKGGAFSLFYLRLNLVVAWHHHGQDISWFSYQRRPREGFGASSRGIEAYFKPALTWPLRASAFSPQVLPAGCIFSNRSHVAIAEKEELIWLLGLMASTPFDFLFKTLLGRFGFPEFIVGTLQVLPVPKADAASRNSLAQLALAAWEIERSGDAVDETSPYFDSPSIFRGSAQTIVDSARNWQELREARELAVTTICKKLDGIVYDLFEIDLDDRAGLNSSSTIEIEGGSKVEPNADERESIDSADACSIASSFFSYSLGCSFGRWDIRFATSERAAPDLPDPFAPLPVCPPGQLQNAQGLPARPEDVSAEYPVCIPWDGILVDEPGHPLDLERHVRKVIEVIWKDRAEAIEHEGCEILGVKALRDYFRKPSGFFADHLKRYSKSRRQAPIYWPLSTVSGSYTLWIYYHRLTDQTLHTAIADFLDPKIKALDREIAALRERAIGSSGNQAGEQIDFQDELKALRAELERVIKLPWKPNLNDGVLITASPLWKLFRLIKWQKDLKACWEALEEGDYDWAHLAYSIWPQRVEKLCETDRSVAIAHGLEHLYKRDPAKAKPKRRKKKAQVENAEISSEL